MAENWQLQRVERKKFDGEPARPLRSAGEFEFRGWDCTDSWAIDAEGQCWKQKGGHGGPLHRVTPEELVAGAEFEDQRKEVRKALGLSALLPITVGSVIWHDNRPWVLDNPRDELGPGAVLEERQQYWVGVSRDRGCNWISAPDMVRREFMVVFDHPVNEVPS